MSNLLQAMPGREIADKTICRERRVLYSKQTSTHLPFFLASKIRGVSSLISQFALANYQEIPKVTVVLGAK